MDQDADLPRYLSDAIAGYLAFGRYLGDIGHGGALPFAGSTAAQIIASHAASASPLPLYDALHHAVRDMLDDPGFARSAGLARGHKGWFGRLTRLLHSRRAPPPPLSAIVRRTGKSARRAQYDTALAIRLADLHATPEPLGAIAGFIRSHGYIEDGSVIARIFAVDRRAGLLLYDHIMAGGDLGALAPWVLASAIEMFHEGRDFGTVDTAAAAYIPRFASADPRSYRVFDRAWFSALRRGDRGQTRRILERWLDLAPMDSRALHCKAVTLSAEPEIAIRHLEQAGATTGDAAEASIVLLCEYAGRIGQFRIAAEALAAAPRTPEMLFAQHNLAIRLDRSGDAAAAAFSAYGLDLDWTRLAVDDVRDMSAPLPSSDVLVSVVLTAFEAEAYLETAVASILAQSHRAIELFIVDDASTDGTGAVARRLAHADPRIRLLRNDRNLGTYLSKNRALKMAQGRYATLCDADDKWLVNHVAEHVAAMAADPAIAVTTSEWVRLSGDGLIECGIGGRHVGLCPHSTFFDRQAFDRMGYFDSVRFGADAEMLHRARLHFGAGGVKHLRRILSLGRRHDASLTTSGPSRIGALAESPLRLRYANDWNAWHYESVRRGTLPVTQGCEHDRPFAVGQELRV